MVARLLSSTTIRSFVRTGYLPRSVGSSAADRLVIDGSASKVFSVIISSVRLTGQANAL